jgi:hypothetical protein
VNSTRLVIAGVAGLKHAAGEAGAKLFEPF